MTPAEDTAHYSMHTVSTPAPTICSVFPPTCSFSPVMENFAALQSSTLPYAPNAAPGSFFLQQNPNGSFTLVPQPFLGNLTYGSSNSMVTPLMLPPVSHASGTQLPNLSSSKNMIFAGPTVNSVMSTVMGSNVACLAVDNASGPVGSGSLIDSGNFPLAHNEATTQESSSVPTAVVHANDGKIINGEKLRAKTHAALTVPQANTPSAAPQPKSFAEMFKSPTVDIHKPSIPDPIVRGENIVIRIDDTLYNESLKSFDNALIGRLILSKGTQPYKIDAVRRKLQDYYSMPQLKVTPLGRGYYCLFFPSRDDMSRAWSGGSVNFKPGTLRLQQWEPDFCPEKQVRKTAQVWVQFYGLTLDYWHTDILLAIAKGVGVPLRIDQATANKDLGIYARVLVEVDFSKDLRYELNIERTGACNKIDVAYEDLPKHCSFCRLVGHMLSECREARRHAESIIPPEKRGGNQTHIRSSDRRQGRSRSRRRRGKSPAVQVRQVYRPVISTSASIDVATTSRVVPHSATTLGLSSPSSALPPFSDIVSGNTVLVSPGISAVTVLSSVSGMVGPMGSNLPLQHAICPLGLLPFSSPAQFMFLICSLGTLIIEALKLMVSEMSPRRRMMVIMWQIQVRSLLMKVIIWLGQRLLIHPLQIILRVLGPVILLLLSKARKTLMLVRKRIPRCTPLPALLLSTQSSLLPSQMIPPIWQ